jgi:phosphate transport system substrate-binding protein
MLTLVISFIGCSTEQKETTTRGNLHVFIPTSLAPVIIDEVQSFLELYSQNGARINYTVASSKMVAAHFIEDSGRIALLPRQLSIVEKDIVRKNYPDLSELVVAYDGIVAVVNQNNTIEQLTTTQLQKILTGAITRWEQLEGVKSFKGMIKVYLEDSSDVYDYLMQRIVKQNSQIAIREKSKSDLQTLEKVEKEKYTLGFVALAWLDSVKSTVKVLNLGRTKEDTDTTFASSAETAGEYFSPHPANIYLNHYPLKRAIHMYTRGKVDLAAGFGTYIATAEGQKLFLKRGLLPATQRIKLRSN